MSNGRIIRQMKLTTQHDATDIIEIVKVVVGGLTYFRVMADDELVWETSDQTLADKRFVRECRDYFHEMC